MDEIIVVLDGRRPVELKSFEDLRAFMSAPESLLVHIDRVIQQAETTEQQRSAVRQFKTWACRTGILVEVKKQASVQ